MRVPGPSRIGRTGEGRAGAVAGRGRRFHEAAGLVDGLEQPFDPLAQLGVVAAGPVEEGGALGRVVPVQGLEEDGAFGTRHGEVSPGPEPTLPTSATALSSMRRPGRATPRFFGTIPARSYSGSISRRSQARA